jgi:Holliday junction resolvase
MIESKLQAKITKRLKDNGWFVTKLIQSSTNGIPDLMAIRKGVVIFLEVKKEGKNADPLQEHRIERFNQMGVFARVVDKLEDIDVQCYKL